MLTKDYKYTLTGHRPIKNCGNWQTVSARAINKKKMELDWTSVERK